jgi:hypothetical protein
MHSTTAAVLKAREDNRSNMEDGQVTVFVILDFSQAFDMVIHGLLLCKLRNLLMLRLFLGWGVLGLL